jgi:hypothetical protein
MTYSKAVSHFGKSGAEPASKILPPNISVAMPIPSFALHHLGQLILGASCKPPNENSYRLVLEFWAENF